jgi:hypothetical protein
MSEAIAVGNLNFVEKMKSEQQEEEEEESAMTAGTSNGWR